MGFWRETPTLVYTRVQGSSGVTDAGGEAVAECHDKEGSVDALEGVTVRGRSKDTHLPPDPGCHSSHTSKSQGVKLRGKSLEEGDP